MKRKKPLFEMMVFIADTPTNRKMQKGLFDNNKDYERTAVEIIGDNVVQAWKRKNIK